MPAGQAGDKMPSSCHLSMSSCTPPEVEHSLRVGEDLGVEARLRSSGRLSFSCRLCRHPEPSSQLEPQNHPAHPRCSAQNNERSCAIDIGSGFVNGHRKKAWVFTDVKNCENGGPNGSWCRWCRLPCVLYDDKHGKPRWLSCRSPV